MTPWAIIGVICGLFAFGAVMYRSGRKSAENAAFKAKTGLWNLDDMLTKMLTFYLISGNLLTAATKSAGAKCA